MTGELSPLHWMVVIVVFMLLFGARRMPDAARSLGRSMRILKAELGADGASEPAATTTPAAPLTYTAPTVAGPAAAATPAAHPEPTTA